jgi:FAD binding domain of DNA photolyase/Rieske [2Fe-2S] domain
MVRNQWYVVLESNEVGAHPIGVTHLGEKMVFWWDAAGKSCTAADRCPHRRAALSVGKTLEGHLQCPFHGFELDSSGWMHNRARMIAASFLTKDLLVDWRWGERYFMQHLLDGDPAANNGGWQWAAGTGTDAAPYFRAFNPALQGIKFDPQGAYVRRWVPELAAVPDRFIHEPWKIPPDVQRQLGCMLGKGYPAQIIDHATARQRALTADQQGDA